MADIAKVITIIGSSPESFAKAADAAVQEAAKTVRGITGADVVSMSARRRRRADQRVPDDRRTSRSPSSAERPAAAWRRRATVSSVTAASRINAGGDVLDPVGRADQVGAVADHADDQAAEERAADAPAAPEEADAADHGGRDGIEQDRAAADGQIDPVEAGGEDDPAEAGHRPGDDEAENPDQLDVDAGAARSLGVAADRVDVTPEGRPACEVGRRGRRRRGRPGRRAARRGVVADRDDGQGEPAVEDDADHGDDRCFRSGALRAGG